MHVTVHAFASHYEHLYMQYTETKKAHAIYRDTKKKFSLEKKRIDTFNIFVKNIDCGYTLEPPCWGGCNGYPQSMFWINNKKNRYTPANPSFSIYKWGLRGYTFHGHVFLMEQQVITESSVTVRT